MSAGTKFDIDKEIAKKLDQQSNVEAVIMMGSCARDEETYFTNSSGEIEMLSDYEMLIVVKNLGQTEQIDRIMKEIREKFVRMSSSPSFDIEWSYKSINELKRLDKRFIFFEAKKYGRVICGKENILQSIPEITIKNLNFAELNTVIIHRLYHVLRDCKVDDEHYQKYLIVRNTLDIPTAALPLMGYLEGTYYNRNRLFQEYADTKYFSLEMTQRLGAYLQMKLNYSDELYEVYDLQKMRTCFIEDFRSLYAFQKKCQNGKAFRISIRQLLSSIYRMKPRCFYQSLMWSKRMEKLCEKMFSFLEDDCQDKDAFNEIQDKMNVYFNYR